MATIYSGSEADLALLADVLRDGGLVAVPTETVYGLAANALDPAACARIFAAKRRPADDPLIVHVASAAAARVIAEWTEPAETLAGRFWPGPLTLVLPKRSIVPDIVTAGLPSVAVRVPAHPLMRALLERCEFPLAAPSANPFGYVSPTTAAHVQESLGPMIGHILDGGPCRVGVESTIVDVRDPSDIVILRPGGVTQEQIESALGSPVRVHRREAAQTGEPRPLKSKSGGEIAPGLLDRHYQPRTPVELRGAPFTAAELARETPGVARVCYRRPAASSVAAPISPGVFFLTEAGEPQEAARRLFGLMRELDHGDWHRLIFELAPPHGLGRAINDRLRRAAGRGNGEGA